MAHDSCAGAAADPSAPSDYRRSPLSPSSPLVVIVVTGAAVRLTGSGLGCTDWPTCEDGRLVAARSSDAPAMVEFVNRLITGLVSVAVIVAVLGSLVRVPRRRDLTWLSSGLVAGVLAQIVLGGLVVLFDLTPVLVLGHFLLSMVLVAERRRAPPPGRRARRAAPARRHALPSGGWPWRWWSLAGARDPDRAPWSPAPGPTAATSEAKRLPFAVHDVGPGPRHRDDRVPRRDARRAAGGSGRAGPGVGRPAAEALLVVARRCRPPSATRSTSPACPPLLVGLHVLGADARVDRACSSSCSRLSASRRTAARLRDHVVRHRCRRAPSRSSPASPTGRRSTSSPDRPWIVLVWNDPINLMSYVTFVFQKLFGYSREKADRADARRAREGPGGRVQRHRGRRPSSTCSASTSTACGPRCSRTD